MINVRTKQGCRKLHERLNASREKIKPHRKTQLDHIREYVGPFYAQDTTKQKELPTVVNLFHQFVETYTLLLVGGQARVLVSTNEQSLKAARSRLQVAVNNVIKEIHLTEIIRQVVLDAIFRVGIVKTFMGEGRQAEIEQNVWMETGMPNVKRISLHDCVYDTTRSRWEEVRFTSDEYELPWEALKQDDFYDRRTVNKIVPMVGSDIHTGGEERVRDMSVGVQDDPAYPDEYATLMDVWLPETGEIAIMSRYDETLLPLNIMEWSGVDEGPYSLLFLGDVPDNIMPVSASDQLAPLHDTFNRLMRKLITQAENQKTINWYEPSARSDMDAAALTPDQGTVKIQNKDGIGSFTFGGADQGNLAFAIQMQSLFDRMAGNLQATAGLGPQSGTLGQDELIHGQVSRKLGKYGEKIQKFVADVTRSIAHLVWEDEIAVIPGEYEIPGLGAIDYPWSAEYREGEFSSYKFAIDPYSLTYESPSVKIAKLERALGTLMQIWPAIEANGGMLNARKVCEDYAELMNMPRLKDWISFGREPPPAGQNEQRQSPHTIRENVRKNVSAGPTNQEADRIMQDVLRGGNSQSNPQQQGQAIALGG